MKNEVWKPVVGYEGLYEVSNTGKVRSLDRLCKHSSGKTLKVVHGCILKNIVLSSKYHMVNLSKDGIMQPSLVHILMMKAFVPNPDNLPQINHKDENPSNNFIWVNEDGSIDLEKSNLEWCSAKYNTNYGTCIKRRTDKRRRKVNQYTADGVFIRQFDGVPSASKHIGVCAGNIYSCCEGKIHHAYGYTWRYVS